VISRVIFSPDSGGQQKPKTAIDAGKIIDNNKLHQSAPLNFIKKMPMSVSLLTICKTV